MHALPKVDSAVAQRISLLGCALEQSTRSTKCQVMADMCWTVNIEVATRVAVMLHQQSSLRVNAKIYSRARHRSHKNYDEFSDIPMICDS